MSTDLLLPQSSPAPPTPPPIKTKPSQTTANAAAIRPPEENDGEEEECKTPTAPENRIPELLTCPPAPRKQRKEEISCKRRKTKKHDFFDAVHRDEVESFFESLGFNSPTVRKRKVTSSLARKSVRT